jgi:DNA invertase Pin-like site-specific DNA recombinase
MQRHAIEKQAEARGDTIRTWYTEKKSAKTVDRPELIRLRGEIRSGRVPSLYIYRLDRLTRSGIRDTLEVVHEIREYGCVLRSCADGFSLEGPHSEIIIAVMAWAAQMERLAINERIAGARERIEAEGGTWGRRPRLGPSEVKRLRVEHAKGRSVRTLARDFKVTRSVVARAVKG